MFAKQKDLFGMLFSEPIAGRREPVAEPVAAAPEAAQDPAFSLADFVASQVLATVASSDLQPWRYTVDDGTKFPGGYGPTDVLLTDYWTLRARSAALFERNIYARGIVRCLVTNEINTGLNLEATPEERLLGLEEDSLADWSEDVENRFTLWGEDAKLCDHSERMTWGDLQATVRREALIEGDILCVLILDQRTKLPRIKLINGASVQSPMFYTPSAGGNEIKHGVEVDANGRHVAYWIRQKDGTSKRLTAWGEKSGRRLAWLVYGTDKRLDDVRGKPLLALVLQSLREIDRYRDSTQRKAVINSMIALVVTRTQPGAPSRQLTAGGGALKNGVASAVDNQGKKRGYFEAQHIPGLAMENLEVGEDVKSFGAQGTDEKFGDFEAAIVSAMAWHFRIPPEILRMTFQSNYSASQAAINEFKLGLNLERTNFGSQFCRPVYVEWFVAAVLNGRIVAAGFLEAWRDPAQYDTFGAWLSADWQGQIKPSVDPVKLVRFYREAIAEGMCTRDRASRETTGTKFSKNIKKLARENLAVFKAFEPIALLEALRKAVSQTPKADKPAKGKEEDVNDDEPVNETETDDAEDDDTQAA